MRQLKIFNHITLDGYFVDAKGDMSWAHKQDPEWSQFVETNSKGGGLFMFGRITYEMMASYWPTGAARENDPVVAERMNSRPKIVFSRTLRTSSWENTTFAQDGVVTQTRKLKAQVGDPIVVFGSGTIVSQLADAGLVDEYQFVVNPIIIGTGRSMFEGVTKTLNLALTSTRSFSNGNLLLNYKPDAQRNQPAA